MTYRPTTKSINVWCPTCKMHFGIAVKEGAVTCPLCKKPQTLPIIQISEFQFMCLSCDVTFPRGNNAKTSCHVCRQEIKWNGEEVSTA